MSRDHGAQGGWPSRSRKVPLKNKRSSKLDFCDPNQAFANVSSPDLHNHSQGPAIAKDRSARTRYQLKSWYFPTLKFSTRYSKFVWNPMHANEQYCPHKIWHFELNVTVEISIRVRYDWMWVPFLMPSRGSKRVWKPRKRLF